MPMKWIVHFRAIDAQLIQFLKSFAPVEVVCALVVKLQKDYCFHLGDADADVVDGGVGGGGDDAVAVDDVDECVLCLYFAVPFDSGLRE